MAWVQRTPESEGIDHVLASHSLNPEALAAHLELYRTIMFGRSGLSRAEREAIGVWVSAANDCQY
jgi:alkylhydroperoxidase family enzyme